MRYDPQLIEPKWQKIWEEKHAFRTETDLHQLRQKPKYYVLDMFPYPSGAGLHVGHPEGYTATDIVARYKRMRGFHVLHPMGWDAFGLPAERAALRENRHPAEITRSNIDNFRKQIKRLGFSYDWSREISTSDPSYYQWTQWIFLKLHERGLAYLSEVPVNWCPALGTVLANEEVKDGKYVETGDPVERRLMKQWMLRITAFAERLLEDLEGLDWPEGVKEMQRNWIGKSIGARVRFSIHGRPESFEVFTTRPDTLFGATYCVLAPEHPLVSQITTEGQKEAVGRYLQEAKNKPDLLRTELAKEKTGVFTGAFAVHPVTGEKVPVWIADYVLMTYGTGAIMAVPAHDERDHAFAKTFGLPIVPVVQGGEKPVSGEAFCGDGQIINSGFLNGLNVADAKSRMIGWLEQNEKGTCEVQYRLRDWLFSRQRYWGEPFPVIHLEDGSLLTLPVSELPLELPQIDVYQPTDDGKPPLARAEDWVAVTLPDGRVGVRETNTMPQWAGSCWYYLRYMDPHNQTCLVDPDLEKYWMPVDLYIGGVEHAVLHLLYARFWHKVLYDEHVVHTKEPFAKLFNQGMILASSYQDENGKYYHPSEVTEKDGRFFSEKKNLPLKTQIEKMSKSRLNVVNPDEVIDQYGADAMRLYELFMGPLEQTKPWQMEGVEGVYRFLGRVWRLFVDEKTGALSEKIAEVLSHGEDPLWRLLHKTIKKVGEDTEKLHFNTAISQMMIFVREATGAPVLLRETLRTFLKVLSPYAPHIAEELWERLGEKTLLCSEEWPVFAPAAIEDTQEMQILMIQMKGRKRGEFQVPKNSDPALIEKLALENETVRSLLQGQTPKKIVVVPGRLVNIVL